MFLVLIFTKGWVDSRAMVRSEGNMSLKNPVTPPGIDFGTVLLVAQHLNHYATLGPMRLCLKSYLRPLLKKFFAQTLADSNSELSSKPIMQRGLRLFQYWLQNTVYMNVVIWGVVEILLWFGGAQNTNLQGRDARIPGPHVSPRY